MPFSELSRPRLFIQHFWRAGAFLATYIGWIFLFYLLVLSLMTYFLMPTATKLQDISEVYASNEIMMAGLSAFGFVILLQLLRPAATLNLREIFRLDLFPFFLTGTIRGVIIGAVIVGAFLLSGYYRYVGYFVQVDDSPIALAAFGLRVITLMLMVCCEEYIFRSRLLDSLRGKTRPVTAVILSALAYCVVKSVQFDLGIMHLASLFLISLFLGARAYSNREFLSGAGYWLGLLLVFHPVFGLPVFGNEFSGIFYIRYQGLFGGFSTVDSRTALFITGGVGGPLSSFALQFTLLLQALRTFYRNQKILLNLQNER